jgi:NAD(P)-dependent dehydrogenase (short-subunit alcohol dehydrogenase family)
VAAKDVLIIGATGALGYSTRLAALSAGHRVRVLARNPSSPLIPAGVDVVKGTAERVADLRRAAADCEAVFYCLNVPITEWESRMETLLANALVAGAGARVRAVPTWALKAFGLFKSDAREFADILHLWSDPVLLGGAKYEARFGRAPRTPYAEGIRETLAWYAGHRPSKAAA